VALTSFSSVSRSIMASAAVGSSSRGCFWSCCRLVTVASFGLCGVTSAAFVLTGSTVLGEVLFALVRIPALPNATRGCTGGRNTRVSARLATWSMRLCCVSSRLCRLINGWSSRAFRSMQTLYCFFLFLEAAEEGVALALGSLAFLAGEEAAGLDALAFLAGEEEAAGLGLGSFVFLAEEEAAGLDAFVFLAEEEEEEEAAGLDVFLAPASAFCESNASNAPNTHTHPVLAHTHLWLGRSLLLGLSSLRARHGASVLQSPLSRTLGAAASAVFLAAVFLVVSPIFSSTTLTAHGLVRLAGKHTEQFTHMIPCGCGGGRASPTPSHGG
jgi:hypothetical protein